MNYVELKTSELTVVIGNNEVGDGRWASHWRPGLNGIWHLSSVHSPDNCWVPRGAGLNIEHYMDDLFDLATGEGGDRFEPRNAPMSLTKVSDSSVLLSQGPTPLTGVESETLFEVIEPHAIDMRFRAKLHRPPRSGKRFGFFWASYINTPNNPALYFRDGKGILNCLSPDQHGRGGGNTVCHESIETPSLGQQGRQYNPGSLAYSFSARRFGPPLMFGYPGQGRMLLLMMFDQSHPVRLTMSHRGGGLNEAKRAYNPAWDFQYILDEADQGTECHLRTRVIYKPFSDIEEIDHLYAEWAKETGQTQQPPKR